MKCRTTLTLALVAGTPTTVAAREVVRIHLSWVEVVSGTINPAAGPLAGNSVVDPGESARIRLGVSALVNGSNAVGQTVNYTNPAPGGVGTVRGLGTLVYDLVGDAGAIGASGFWYWMNGPSNPPFAQSISGATVMAGGSIVRGIVGSQFIGPGGSANGTNNDVMLFRGAWTPAS